MITLIGTAQKEKTIFLYYLHKKETQLFFKVVQSTNGYLFEGKSLYVIVTDERNREEKQFNWEDVRFSKQKDTYLITYKTLGKNRGLNTAFSKDLIHWTKQEALSEIKESAAIVSDYKYKNKYVMFVGDQQIRIAFSGNLTSWKTGEIVLAPRPDYFDKGSIKVGDAIQSNGNILLLYYTKKEMKGKHSYQVGAALFDKKDPNRILWRSDKPIWEQTDDIPHDTFEPLGIAEENESLILYWRVNDNQVYAVSCQIPGKYHHLQDKEFNTNLNRHAKNPIITPEPGKPWESRATFNTAAVVDDGKVHFLYRALGDSDLSVIGYATSKDGITIDERSDEPIYIPREPFETPGGKMFKNVAEHFVSGGGYGGIEDPRITKLEDRMYLTYVAFDGATPPRAAMSSISVDDFRKRNWDKWDKARLISAPGMVNKSAVVFPEKVNGKYVVFHRVYPNILIDFRDNLDFKGDDYLQGQYFIPPRKKFWDSKKIGAGAPPIKTKDGWLLIYQSVGYQDPGRYKIGAMLLDKTDPTKVLYRTSHPLIAPDAHYENAGHKAGVVYPCGAVVKDNELMVYYGGADTVVCAATQNLDTFLEQMKYNQEPKMKRVTTPLTN
jgi:beta-1,2-mannobiose phosphorylase / 1,2-beta-oligomannan phosphorylase